MARGECFRQYAVRRCPGLGLLRDLVGQLRPHRVVELPGQTNYVDWLGAGVAANCNMVPLVMPTTATGVGNGYTVAYVINRMCNLPGAPKSQVAGSTVTCASYVSPATATGSTQVGAVYGTGPFVLTNQHYYRITTRTTGPRNTVRYTQTFVII